MKGKTFFSTRHLPQRLIDEMRIEAALWSREEGKRIYLHEVHTDALERGIGEIKGERRETQKRGKSA